MNLFQQLKNVGKWVFNLFLQGGEAIGEAEERIMFAPIERTPIMWVSHARSLAKAVSWRFFGTLISWVVIFELTHKGRLAFIASGIELVVKIVLYYYHERAWNKVKWGRE